MGTKQIEPIIYTPAQTKHKVRVMNGKCPIPLRDRWDLPILPPDPIICDWFWDVREWGLAHNMFLTAECIANWAGTEFDPINDQTEYDHIELVIFEYANVIGDYLAPPQTPETPPVV